MGESVKVYMDEWLKTSGVVGLFNILKYANEEVSIGENYIEFDKSAINNFEEKYFSYFIEKYKDILSIFKIISFEEFIKFHEESDFENFDSKSLDSLNKYLTDILKKQVKSNSYKAAYDLISDDTNILELEKDIKTIKPKKSEKLEDVLGEIKITINKIKVIINYMKSAEAIKYIAAKNVMYTVIKNGWNGVCFLNAQTKEKDMYMDYKNYFVDPSSEYLEADKSKYKYKCFSCDGPMKDLKNDLSFINAMGFDVARKSSHVWDFQNDVATCPICKLVYSCVPAGINYIYDSGIYVNDNNSMKKAININEKIYMEIYKNKNEGKKLTYRALVQSINNEYNEGVKYELSDIQLVRYEDEKYKFNILSKNALRIIKDSEGDLNSLVNAGFKEVNTYFNIYELVVDRLLNGQNMFTLLQKLLHYKLSQKNDSYYNGYHIIRILKINNRFLEGVGLMKVNEEDIVKLGNASGYFLREKYRSKGAVDKLGGVSYRLLNALKTNNKDAFMDTVLNCYLYAKLQVPKVLLDVLKSDEEFKTIGYAFVTGLIEGENKENGGK